MTNKIEQTTPAFTNAQVDALVIAARAANDADKAQGKVARAAVTLHDAGVTGAMLETGTPSYVMARRIVGEAVLSKADAALFFDTSLAQKIKDPTDESRRILTPAGKVHQRVTMMLTRIRNAVSETEKTGPEARGTRTTKTLKARITDNVGALVKAVNADAKKEAPTLKPERAKELLAAFQRALDLAK